MPAIQVTNVRSEKPGLSFINVFKLSSDEFFLFVGSDSGSFAFLELRDFEPIFVISGAFKEAIETYVEF